MGNRRLKVSLAVLLALLVIWSLPAWSAPALRVRGHARQGGILFVSVEGADEGTTGKAVFLGRTVLLEPGASGLQAVFTIPADARAGTAPLKVTLTSGEQETKLDRNVTVAKYPFGRQYLSMSSDQADKYEDPRLDREYNLIDGALGTFSQVQLWNGPFAPPIEAPVTTDFGVMRYVNGESHDYHRGIDMGGWQGQTVRAANDGVVVLTGPDFILHGKTVAIDHGQGLTTIYLHMSAILVKKGQAVKKGDPIGKVGMTGASTGPHLHWGAYCGGIPFDPRLLYEPPASWSAAPANPAKE